MAYIRIENGAEEGPYPNKKGEFCGNYHPNSEPYANIIETTEQAHTRQAAWLSKMRFGRPRPCEAGTTEELEQQGYVGLYLKKDESLGADGIEVPTPEELREPNDKK